MVVTSEALAALLKWSSSPIVTHISYCLTVASGNRKAIQPDYCHGGILVSSHHIALMLQLCQFSYDHITSEPSNKIVHRVKRHLISW